MNDSHPPRPSHATRLEAIGPRSSRRVGPGIAAILLTLLPLVVLLYNTELRTRGVHFQEMSGDWTRAWDDVAIGAGMAAHDSFPVAPYIVTNGFSRKGQTAFSDFKETFRRLEETHSTHLSRPWEGFEASRLFPRRPRLSERFDDQGRSFLLGLGFRVVGRVSPGLIFWLGPAFASLVLTWIVFESRRARLTVFGVVISLLVAVSAFCGDVLMLGYSAAGFYLVAILTCVAYALGTLCGTASGSGLLWRSLMAGSLLSISISARSVSIMILPAILITTALAARGVSGSRRRRTAFGLGASLLLLAPALLLRSHLTQEAKAVGVRFGGKVPPLSHDVWITYWQGLGDFDRTHGHVFLDQAGLETLRKHGGKERVSAKSEAIMRGVVLDSIRKEPSWFVGILFERALATVSFRKLWPTASAEGPGFVPRTTPNEGATDTYWTMTEQADVFRIGGSRIEIPAFLFPLVLIVFVGVSLRRLFHESSEIHKGLFRVVALPALAAFPGPVLTTTAGAFEPQAFVVVGFAAFSALAQIGVASWRARRGARIIHDGGTG